MKPKANAASRKKPGNNMPNADPIAEAIALLDEQQPVDTLEDRLQKAEAFLSPLPQVHQQTHYLITEDLPTYVLAEAVVKMSPPPVSLAVATMGFNHAAVAMFGRLLDAAPNLEIDILAGIELPAMEPDVVAVAKRDLEGRGVRIFYARNHSKVTAIQCEGDTFRTLEGSGNMRRCKRMENLTITAHRQHFEFYSQWIQSFTRP